MVGRQVVDAAIKVHRSLGPGLLESAYEHCLGYELHRRGLTVDRQLSLPIQYDEAQLLTYLKLSGRRLGYLMNFNTTQLKQGLRRFVR